MHSQVSLSSPRFEYIQHDRTETVTSVDFSAMPYTHIDGRSMNRMDQSTCVRERDGAAEKPRNESMVNGSHTRR